MISRRVDKGFTLIEIVTVIVVLGILGAFSLTFIDNAIKTYMIAKTQRNLSQEAAYILEKISREIKDSYCYVVAAQYRFRKTHITIDDNPYIWFRYSGTDLRRVSRDPGDSTDRTNQLLGRNVTSFSITLNSSAVSADSFNVTLTLSKDGQTVILSTTVCPKNYCQNETSATCTPGYTDRNFNGDYEDFVQ